MTSGIYSLNWEGCKNIYIGQSIDIEARVRTHINKMRRGIASTKLQEAYHLYGTPTYKILAEITDQVEMDIAEKEAISIFDSIKNGYNVNEGGYGGCSLYGQEAGNSCYTNEQIEASFLLLVNKQELCAKDISNITGVHKTTVDAISSFKVHTWLKDKYPIEYKILQDKRSNSLRFGKGKTLKERGIIYPKIVDPSTGIAYTVENTSQFAKVHKLNNAHLVQVLKGQEKQHKGWRLESG